MFNVRGYVCACGTTRAGLSPVTLMPVLVASLTASSKPSNFGLKVTVKAQSMIRPNGQSKLNYLTNSTTTLASSACFQLRKNNHFPTIDVRPKVDLADVVVAQHRGISCVGGVVSSTVVDGTACGEGQSRPQAVLLDEPPGTVLQPLAGSHKENISCFPPG